MRSRAGAEARRAPAALIDLALELLEVGGKSPLTLTPVARSKAERGYQLAAQTACGGGQGVRQSIRQKRNTQSDHGAAR